MNMNQFLKVFADYNGMVHGHGVYDCNLMVLEATGYDIDSIPPYSTAMEGLRSLRSFGFRRMGDYLKSIGYKQIDPIFISDFSIVVLGASCGIYFDGFLFSLQDNRFGFHKINKNYFQNNKIEVYQWALR